MKHWLHPDMREATRLTRAGRLTEATALLQRLLRSGTEMPAAPGTDGEAADPPAADGPPVIDGEAEVIEPSGEPTAPRPSPDAMRDDPIRLRVPKALRGFLERINRIGTGAGEGSPSEPPGTRARDTVQDEGRFLTGSYGNDAGSRAYKLYVPSGYRGQALPLVVMLHGCTQSPDDFAAGTRMNALAEEQGCFVVYPAQAASANASKCWNWFRPEDQRRGRGEPSLIAGITRQIMRDYTVDPRRVYVAGLSAGGAAAAIMGAAYPDLYAAIGVHSGLACGAASDLPSAFAAMRGGAIAAGRRSDGAWEPRRIVPAIVFHGGQDTTVHPCNGEQVIAQSTSSEIIGLATRVERGQVPGGHAYSRILHTDASGVAVFERWVVHGAGHAWSGGSPAGTYTDPRGPDAAREMLRFFLEHPHPIAARPIQS